MDSPQPHAIIESWLHDFKYHADFSQHDDPNYYVSAPETLITSSTPVSFALGTGSQILSSTLSKCASTQYELIIVTCFWAKSSSQEAICSLLLNLSAKAISQNRKIQVRMCFSSRSIAQKLFQTSKIEGKIYPASLWVQLGLPSPKDLRGLEMVVKSVFIRPFCVMHPKFILIDRKTVFMPSCNVSWENWFEGCIEAEGEIARSLFEFWINFWARGIAPLPPIPVNAESFTVSEEDTTAMIKHIHFAPDFPAPTTILLPSPHHINPHFSIFLSPKPPPTPLNIFLLSLLTNAKHSIFIQTPNLTSSPLISALFLALQRGINIHLITSSHLMILEQLVTASTITEFEVWKLRRRYTRLLSYYHQKSKNPDPENPTQKPGELSIGYYHSRKGGKVKEEPVKSHLKLVMVDEEVTVLGSGNMDRASWYTSQELGVAFFSREMAGMIRECVDGGLEGRVEYVC
jgi:phosphatidylserine/phosphatidylglycerophosphate/cardiolipin synthase-like enzyme